MTPVQRVSKLFRECEKFSQDDGIAWKALVVVQAILDFSGDVQKLFPPGGPVRFSMKYGGPELTGTVCEVQYPREVLPDGGLFVCVSGEIYGSVPEHRRIRGAGENVIVIPWGDVHTRQRKEVPA